MSVLELHKVTRRFGALTAVDRVSLRVEEGEIMGLLGHNGAGKTTLLRVINGLLAPDEGAVRVLGLDPVTAGDRVRRSTGVLTEYPALDEYLSVTENLRTYATIHGVPRHLLGPRVDALLERLGLWERRDTPARSLSAGLKQRVALARSLVHEPPVMLLDEPTTNMDPVAAREVRQLIVERATTSGGTVLLSTHNLVEAEQLCDRVAIIRRGVLLRCGPPDALRREAPRVHGVRISTEPAWLDMLLALRASGVEVQRVGPATVEVHGDVQIPAIVAQLAVDGVPLHAVEPLGASLEDLYVALHADGVTGASEDRMAQQRVRVVADQPSDLDDVPHRAAP